MGFLQWDGGSFDVTYEGVTKGVIAFWFRVPAASIAAAKAQYDAWLDSEEGDAPPLNGIIPLVIFGPADVAKRITFTETDVDNGDAMQASYQWNCHSCAWELTPTSIIFPNNPYLAPKTTQFYPSFSGATYDIDPSYIGLDCTSGVAKLSINMTMAGTPTMEGAFPQIISSLGDGQLDFYGHINGCFGIDAGCIPPMDEDGNPLPENSYHGVLTYEGFADIWLGRVPETFRTLTSDDDDEQPYMEATDTGGRTVTADKWHHIIFSFDFSGTVTSEGLIEDEVTDNALTNQQTRSSSACQMFLSYDDHNLTGTALSAYCPFVNSNTVLTPHAFRIASYSIFNDRSIETPVNNHQGYMTSGERHYDLPSYSFTPTGIKTVQNIGVPGSETYSDKVYAVELAKMQMWTGDIINTGDVEARRMFVTAGGKPAEMSIARAYLGRPIVEFDKQADWLQGLNRGSAGDFTVEGTVVKYDVDPAFGS